MGRRPVVIFRRHGPERVDALEVDAREAWDRAVVADAARFVIFRRHGPERVDALEVDAREAWDRAVANRGSKERRRRSSAKSSGASTRMRASPWWK